MPRQSALLSAANRNWRCWRGAQRRLWGQWMFKGARRREPLSGTVIIMEEEEHLPVWLLPSGLTRRWRPVGRAAWAHPGRVSALLPLRLHALCLPLYLQSPQWLLPSRSVCIYCWHIPSGNHCFLLHSYKECFCVPSFISPHRNVKLFWWVCFRSHVCHCLWQTLWKAIF